MFTSNVGSLSPTNSIRSPSNQCPNAQPENDLETFSLIEKIENTRRSLTPLTLPDKDQNNRTIQLWKYKNSLIASVHEESGEVHIISEKNIQNPLSKGDLDGVLIDRLQKIGLRRWHFVYMPDNGKLSIWPHLIASGQDENWTPIPFTDNNAQLGHMFGDRPGHLSKDNPENRIIIQKATDSPKNFVGKGRAGEFYLKKHSDGTQSWAVVKNGVIVKGGLNDRPSKFIASMGGFVRWENRFTVVYPKNYNGGNSKGRVGAENVNYKQAHEKGKGAVNRMTVQQPAMRQFEKVVQQTKLTDSYRASHPDNPVAEKGMTGGKIGGVACSAEYMEGLFDTPESLFEAEHFFCLKTPDGKLPFTDEELRQITRELAIAIYVHGAIPFFSLHFNQDAGLFPVIHPAYEHTLVGRVISMLDYFMKGYLNGGVFSEDFIDKWHLRPDWKAQSKSAFQELIDFELYCSKLSGENKNYLSLRTLTESFSSSDHFLNKLFHLFNTEKKQESKTLAEFDGFRNSFRIIAKQNSFKKSGNVIEIDADFDVEYTIEPSAKYQKELESFKREHGELPQSYIKLVSAFEFMKRQIHDHMQSMPLCKKYFSMLGVIHFLSCYFSSMKKHRKVPLLAPIDLVNPKGSPPLFPHLPLTIQDKEELRLCKGKVVTKTFSLKTYAWLEAYFIAIYDHLKHRNKLNDFQSDKKGDVLALLQKKVKRNILSNCSLPFRHFIEKNNKNELLLGEKIHEISKEILDELLEIFSICVQRYLELPREQRISSSKMIRSFIDKIPEMYKNEIFPISHPIPYRSTVINSEASEKEVDKAKRIVGGCGLRMEKMSLNWSEEGEELLHNHWQMLSKLEPEHWERVELAGSSAAVFGLKVGDLPYDMQSDYTWMQQFFFTQPDDNNHEQAERKEAVANAMFKIQQAIEECNKKAFKESVAGVSPDVIAKMRDKNGATLLCYAAMNESSSYLKTLLKLIAPSMADLHGYLPSHYAAMANSTACLKVLAAKAPDTLKAKCKNESTPLTIAIQYEAVAAVEFFLQAGPEPTVLTDGYTDLHCALHGGNKEIISLVLKCQKMVQPYINICSEEGGTPLMLACELDDPEIVQKLIDKGAEVCAKRRDGLTAIEIACRRQSLPVLEVLLKKGKPSSAALEFVLKEGSNKVINTLIPHIPKFTNYKNAFGDNPAHISIRNGNLPVAFFLANEFPQLFKEINKEKINGYGLALALNAWDIVAVLFNKHGLLPEMEELLSINYHPMTQKILNSKKWDLENLQNYFDIAAGRKNRDAVCWIAEKMEPSQVRNNLLKLIFSDDLTTFKKHFSEELLNFKTTDGKTYAYIAAENESIGIVVFLLNEIFERKLSLESHFGKRHLFYPIMNSGNYEFIERMITLVPSLVDVTIDEQGTKPLHLAAKMGLLSVLKLLVSKEVDINCSDQNGRTPLHYAIMLGYEEAVAFLIKSKSPIDAHALFEAAAISDKMIQILMQQGSLSKRYLDQALFEAVSRSDMEAAIRLHAQGGSFSHAQGGWTPLLLASKKGQAELLSIIIKDLMKNSPMQLKFVNPEGDNALHLASKEGHGACTLILLENGFDKNLKNAEGKTSFNLAQDKKNISMLLQQGSGKWEADEMFMGALAKGNPEEIEPLLPLFSGNETIPFLWNGRMIYGTAVQLAIRCSKGLERIQAIKWLQSSAMDINFRDGNGETVAHLLVRKNISPTGIKGIDLQVRNNQGQTPLHLAAAEADEHLLQELIKALTIEDIDTPDHAGKTSIFYSIEGKKDKNLSLLLKSGAGINHYDKHLLTPLISAIRDRNSNAVNLLLRNGADPNKPGTIARVSPLFVSVVNKEIEITYHLLLQGASLDQAAEEGLLPLHVAAKMGHVEQVRLLSMDRQSLFKRDSKGQQAIHYAAMNGHPDVILYISQLNEKAIHSPIENQKNKGSESDNGVDFFAKATPLHLAALSGSAPTVDRLLKLWADPEALSQQKESPLLFGMQGPAANAMIELFNPYKIAHEADQVLSSIVEVLKNDNVDALQTLYAKGVPIDWTLLGDHTGLHIASYSGALQCTAWLLNQGANPTLCNEHGKNPFEIAASNKFYEQFKLLLMHSCPDLDASYSYGYTLMHLAALEGRLMNVIVLAKLGASLNLKDFMGNTPLHCAVKEGRLDVAQLLLALGADSNLKSQFGKIPRELALSENAKKLFEGYEKALKRSDSDSKLHFAVRMNDRYAVQLLLDDEQVDIKNGAGMTALHVAVCEENVEIALLLLQNGADSSITDHKGQTPLMLAQQKDGRVKEKFLKIFKNK